MTFIHPLLLGGLVLAGIPVLLHLIMRQQPKRLSFPAFRFLVQRARSNQRKLQLRHLLLLLLRILLIALICLALARPKVLNEGINLAAGQPLAVALVFDTSASMEYKVGERSRLDDAKRRALELLDDLPDDSRLSVFDSGEPVSGEWLQTIALARERIANLQIRPANHAVTDALFQAYRLLGALDQEERTGEPLPRFLYVFSDRTQDSWDNSRRAQLLQLRDSMNPAANAVFVDVGVDKPENLAVTDLELRRQVIPANDELVLTAKLQATGRPYDTEVICRIDNDEKTKEHKPLKLAAGQGTTVQFRRRIQAVGMHQVEVTLGAPDNLPFSAVRFATFEVRGPRQVLIVTDAPGRAAILEAALRGSFHCDVFQPAKAADLTPRDLSSYQTVCLLDVADPSTDLWEKLKRYVDDGGGLVVMPGGSELRLSAYKDEGNPEAAVTQLLPGVLLKEVENDAGLPFDEAGYREPTRTWWRDWVDEDTRLRSNGKRLDLVAYPAKAFRYWSVQPVLDESVIATYADEGHHAALLMKTFPRGRKTGRVLLFTTAMDGRKIHENSDRRCNNYLETSFYFSLANKLIDYLAGGADAVNYNYAVGQTVTVVLPVTPRFPTYNLQGPGLGAGTVLPLAANQGELKITQAVQPGQFTLASGDGQWQTGFSANVPAGECNLSRVPTETIEAVFGPKSVLAPGHNTGFKEALQEHWNQPVELFPWLMILLLLALALENLLANRFYRREEPAASAPGASAAGAAQP